MIPKHMQHLTAVQIVQQMRERYEQDNFLLYVTHLEGLLTVAVSNALKDANERVRIQELVNEEKEQTTARAVMLLSMVLPATEEVN